MKPSPQLSRINLLELKAQLARKLGPERSRQYFDYLNRLLSLKLSKVEFDKLCLRIIGRENIPLHNQLIRSILKNACSAKASPPTNNAKVANPSKASKNSSVDPSLPNGSHSIVVTKSSSPLALSNGDVLQQSPRKARTVVRDRRGGDRRSALGPNGKSNFALQQPSAMNSGDLNVIVENGCSLPADPIRPEQQYEVLKQKTENGEQLPIVERSVEALLSVQSKELIQKSGQEGKAELSGRSLVHAPLGVPLFPVSVGGARRALPFANSSSDFSNNSLMESLILRQRMEQIVATQALHGVSMDCANALNMGLDAYLKGLIRSCSGLVGARSGHDPVLSSSFHPPNLKPFSGVRPNYTISMRDFRVAMELNPQQLGEDWPLLLEKIFTRAFEE